MIRQTARLPTQVEDFLLGAPLPAELDDEEPGSDSGGSGPSLPLYDWWGSMREVRRRGPERLSIIFAFDDPR